MRLENPQEYLALTSLMKKRHGVSMPFLPDNIHLIAAHHADLLVDVTVAVDIVLLYAAWRYPSEYRIVT